MKLTSKTVLPVGSMYEVSYDIFPTRYRKPWVDGTDCKMVVMVTVEELTEYEKRNGYRTFDLLASTHEAWNRAGVELFYRSIQTMKPVTVKELPLYVGWEWKSDKFLELLKVGL